MRTGRYNIIQLLTSLEVDQIIIPEIQRDYVWKESNVLGLLRSIWSNYTQKQNLTLDIKCDGYGVTDEVSKYLTDEYQRIRFSTNVGFLYAYHDPTYIGKLFLIDGQQRITTLLLVLLAAYCGSDLDNVSTNELKKEYCSKYFRNGLPKLDYKVREVTHDFLIAFVSHLTSDSLTSDSKCDFCLSANYYDVFGRDITTKAMLANYATIRKFLCDNGVYDNQRDFIDYIEHYVEFNYFDTSLSEQGEKLYLYMNSRGEELSEQENVKAILISRSKNKLNDSRKWEDWQNFFWNERGENRNADQGFKLFLQHATSIHLCVINKLQLTSSQKETKLKEILQKNEGRDYLQENTDIDVTWLEKVFDATKKFASFNAVADGYLREKWLSAKEEDLHMIDYVTILGCIYYMTQYPDATELDVKRLGMHLKNICFDPKNSKNPDSAVIISLEAIKEMCKHHITDIADAPDSLDERFYSASDKRKSKLYHTQERSQWEDLFWKTTNYDNDKFNSFIRGNTAILLDLCDGNDGTDVTISPDDVQKTFENFYDKVYNQQRKNKNLRLKMLEYGDISRYDNGGSWLLKDKWLGRYNLISTDDDWYDLLSDRGSPAFATIKNFLNGTVVPTTGILSVLKDPQYGCIEYMDQLKFLWDETEPLPHMILLAQHQASVSTSRELAVQMLHKRIKDSWVWENNTCVVEFYYENGKLCIGGENHFHFDIVYQHNNGTPYWSLYVGHRRGKLEESMEENLKIATAHDWKYCSDNGRCYVERFSALSNPSSFTDVVETVIEDFEKIKGLLTDGIEWKVIENKS